MKFNDNSATEGTSTPHSTYSSSGLFQLPGSGIGDKADGEMNEQMYINVL